MTRGELRGSTHLALPPFATALTAFLGGQFRPGEWYASLKKPPFNPPDIAFPIAWTILYSCIAVAGALIAYKKDRGAMRLFYLQLALNALWTPLFFGLQSPELALIEIFLLLIAIGATIVKTKRVSRAAAILLVPYLAWVSFAAYLTAGIVILN